MPDDTATEKLADGDRRRRIDHRDLRACVKQARNLLRAYLSATHYQAAPTFEFEKNRKQIHLGKSKSRQLSTLHSTPCGTRCEGESRSTGANCDPARNSRNSRSL